MLAPCFKTAEELGLTQSQRDALIKVLGRLERGELKQVHVDNMGNRGFEENDFSMRSWQTCICGHAMRYADFPESARTQGGPTGSLFYRTCMDLEQAAASLRDYLTGYNSN